MRLALILPTLSVSLIAASVALPGEQGSPMVSRPEPPGPVTHRWIKQPNEPLPYPGEQGRPIVSRPKQRYTVLCRRIKQHDESLAYPAITVTDGAKWSISDISQSPFVIGVTRVTDPITKAVTQRPHIVVLEDGMKIDLIVAGRQADGATVDVTVEQSKIAGEVAIKECSPGTRIQIPSVDIEKKRVFDFVKFGEAFVVPLGEKRAKGTRSRLEIVVAVGEPKPPLRPAIHSKPAKKLVMGGVTPRVIIQKEEEERLGILP